MVILYIILGNNPLIDYLLLRQKIYGIGLLQEDIPMYFSLVSILSITVACHTVLPVTVLIPSDSRILLIL